MKDSLYGNMYLIIGSDTKLLSLLIKLSHVVNLNTHRDQKATSGYLMRDMFGIYNPNFTSMVKQVVNKCVTCRRIIQRSYRSDLIRYSKLKVRQDFQ